jgi:hypothetical protein
MRLLLPWRLRRVPATVCCPSLCCASSDPNCDAAASVSHSPTSLRVRQALTSSLSSCWVLFFLSFLLFSLSDQQRWEGEPTTSRSVPHSRCDMTSTAARTRRRSSAQVSRHWVSADTPHCDSRPLPLLCLACGASVQLLPSTSEQASRAIIVLESAAGPLSPVFRLSTRSLRQSRTLSLSLSH